MPEGKSMPGWVVVVLVLVGAYLVIKALSNAANSAIKTVGATKASTAQGYAQAAGTAASGLASAIGSFWQSTPSQPTSGATVSGGTTIAPGAASSSDAVYQAGDSFDDYSAGLFGPGINADGTGAS